MVSEYIEKYQKIVKFYNIDTNRLSDIVHAIVLSDMHGGSNRQELDIDRLYSKNMDSRLCDLWQINNTAERNILPDVQLLRIMCDSLFIYLHDNPVPATYITSEMSSKVYNIVSGGSMEVTAYCDEVECAKILDAYEKSCIDTGAFDWVEKFDKVMSKSIEYIEKNINMASSCEDSVKSCLKSIVVPVKSKYLRQDDWDYSGVVDIKTYVLDNVIYLLECDIRTRIMIGLEKNPVGMNYRFSEAVKALGNPIIGTFSVINACPVLNSQSGFPNVIKVKLARLYSVGKAYSFGDISIILSLYCVFMAKCGHADFVGIRDYIDEVMNECWISD